MTPQSIINLTVGERDPLERRVMEKYRDGTRVNRIEDLQHFTTVVLHQRSAKRAAFDIEQKLGRRK